MHYVEGNIFGARLSSTHVQYNETEQSQEKGGGEVEVTWTLFQSFFFNIIIFKNLLKDEATRKEMLSRAAKTQSKCFSRGGKSGGKFSFSRCSLAKATGCSQLYGNHSCSIFLTFLEMPFISSSVLYQRL